MAKVSANRLATNTREGATMSTLFVPAGVELFDLKSKGPHRLIVVPYTVPAGAKNPNAKDGELYFERSYWAHRGLGANEDQTVICPKATFGKRCPICEAREMGKRDGTLDKEQVKALYPKHRTLINIYNLNDVDTGVQIWDISYFLFLQKLIEDAKNGDIDPETGESEDMFFADPEDGKELKVMFTEEVFGKSKFYKASSVRFKSHGGLKADLLEKANILDSLLVEKSYDEIYEMFHQMEPDDTDVVDEKPKATIGVKKTEKPKEELVDQDLPFTAFSKGDTAYHAKYGKCSVLKVTDDVITIMDSNDDPYKVSVDDLSVEPIAAAEPVVEDKPKAKADKPKAKAESKKETVPADEEKWDEDWDEDK
jgi:hypothetical protein